MAVYSTIWNRNGSTTDRVLLLGSTSSSVSSLPSGYSGTLYKDYSTTNCDVSGLKPWNDYVEYVKEVVIMNDIYPVNCDYLFNIMYGLTTITNISRLKTSNATTMNKMFYGCNSSTSLDLSSFNTSNVNDMNAMFYGCSSLTSLDLSSLFNTSNVTVMSKMFSGCISLTSLDLSSFNTSNVNNMNGMFFGCSSLTTIYVDEDLFKTNNVTSSNNMFRSCLSIVGQNGTTYDANSINVTYARIDKPNQAGYFTKGVKPIYFNGVKYKNVYFNGVKYKNVYFNGVKYT